MTNIKDERADRDRLAADIAPELREKVAAAVDEISQIIKMRLAERNKPLLVAIDGGSAAGKSTIAMLVADKVHATIIQGDDFYQTGIDWSKKTVSEKASLCIDWERARREALEPLLMGRTASWRPFNFKTGIGLADYEVVRNPAPVIIIDGIYSANPTLADILDVTVLVEAPTNVRYIRHNEREGHDDVEWHETWDEVELYYFETIRPPTTFDLTIKYSNS